MGRLKRGQEFCLSYQNIPGMFPEEQRELQPPQAGGLAPGTRAGLLEGGGWVGDWAGVPQRLFLQASKE